MDKETYDSLPITRWLDKSGKPIEDHPELSTELQESTTLKRQPVQRDVEGKKLRSGGN